MNLARELVVQGGPAIIAIMVLSVLLYERCFNLLMYLRERRRWLANEIPITRASLPLVRRCEHELQETFSQQRLAIGAMITAAPLLGLLGTVMGMIGAFESLAQHGRNNAMEGLAQGISEVLIDTQSGLAVAIPAVLLLYYAHRQLQKSLHQLTHIEASINGE